MPNNEMVKLVNLNFCGAMGIPQARSMPSKRLLRHFFLVHLPEFSSETMFRIFSKILDLGYSSYPDLFRK